MRDRQVRNTAMGTAYLRAAHQLIDSPPYILNDNVTEKLIDNSIVQRIKKSPESFQTAERRELRSHVVLRSRYAEDRLSASLSRGINQYIILGAGFDTFAYRQPNWAKSLKIFEVDREETQKIKCLRIQDAGLVIPKNVEFISIDFEKESLFEGLVRNYVSFESPTYFSWLGVTMYLDNNSMDAVLQTVVKFPKGSEIVFTFAQPKGTFLSQFKEHVAEIGEPWKSYYTIDEINKKLKIIGFTKVDFLSIKEAEENYYHGRPNDLPIPKRIGIVSAIR